MQKTAKRILVVGPLADQVPVLLGNDNNQPSRAVTALDGIKAAFPGAEISFVPGTNFLRQLDPVPVAVLKTPEGQPGVKAEYFPSADLSGAASLTRVYPALDFVPRVSGALDA